VALLQRGAGFVLDVGGKHARTFVDEALRRGQADARAGAGDEGDLVLEAWAHRSYRQWKVRHCGTVAAHRMALKSTIYKAQLQIADMDRQLYAEHALTLALHPSETEERLLVRLLAFALQVPHDTDLTGELLHWIEVGQPDERRLSKACARAERVTLYCFGSAADIWWAGIRNKLTRLSKLQVWQLPSEQAQALARLASRSMQWQITVQDGHVWVHSDGATLELLPVCLMGADRNS
jgi:uncharacterized protein YaeQ